MKNLTEISDGLKISLFIADLLPGLIIATVFPFSASCFEPCLSHHFDSTPQGFGEKDAELTQQLLGHSEK